MLLWHSLRHTIRERYRYFLCVCVFFRSLVLLLYIHILTIYIFLFVLSCIFSWCLLVSVGVVYASSSILFWLEKHAHTNIYIERRNNRGITNRISEDVLVWHLSVSICFQIVKSQKDCDEAKSCKIVFSISVRLITI
jgi:hypothetical protein